MRTTIDLPEDLHRIALSIARDKGQRLSDTVAELIRRGLGRNDRDELPTVTVDAQTGFPLVHTGMPITSEDVRALEDE